MISLGGLLDIPRDMPILDYLTFLQATRFVTGSQTEVVKAFRLACFNVFAKNYDDHSGNFSFLYDEDADRYALSPAYDLTRTPNMREHHMTCMGNPLPGEKELLQLASRMDIPGARAKEIVTQIGDTVRAELSEWLSRGKGQVLIGRMNDAIVPPIYSNTIAYAVALDNETVPWERTACTGETYYRVRKYGDDKPSAPTRQYMEVPDPGYSSVAVPDSVAYNLGLKPGQCFHDSRIQPDWIAYTKEGRNG